MRLAGLPQHPADRLADKELPILQHPFRVAREPAKVAAAPAQWAQQRQHRGAAHPEVAVLGPAVEDPEQFWSPFNQRASNRDRQLVDKRPRLRLTDQLLEEAYVRRA